MCGQWSCYQLFETRICFHFQDINQWKQQVPHKYQQPRFRLKVSPSLEWHNLEWISLMSSSASYFYWDFQFHVQYRCYIRTLYWRRVVQMLVTKSKKQTQWPVVRKRTIPTEWPPLVGEVSINFCGERVSRGQFNTSPRPLISVF
jgi:hypothetical protein